MNGCGLLNKQLSIVLVLRWVKLKKKKKKLQSVVIKVKALGSIDLLARGQYSILKTEWLFSAKIITQNFEGYVEKKRRVKKGKKV